MFLNAFLEGIYNNSTFENFQTLKCIFYVLYIDDCFVILNRYQLDINHTLLATNSIDPCIQSTCRKEVDKVIPFLDISICYSIETFSTILYWTRLTSPVLSYLVRKLQLLRLFYRVIVNCSSLELLISELNYFNAFAFDQPYSPYIIYWICRKFSQPCSSKNGSSTTDFCTSVVLPLFLPE